MTDRLTDDEIRELRELSKLVPPAPWGEDALARLLDEIEERRRVERAVAAELRMGLDKEQWCGTIVEETVTLEEAIARLRRKDGGA